MLTTFAALIMPVIVLLMAMVINAGHIVDSKIKLQIAVDRSAYAGAAKQAHIMNWMAAQNWEIQKKFLDLKKELEDNSTQSEEQGRRRFNHIRQEINDIAENMDDWSVNGMAASKAVADAMALANYPNARPLNPPLYSPMLTLRNDLEDKQYQKLEWHGMQGLFVDPENHNSASDKILTYLIKDDIPIVRWETRLLAPIPSGFLTATLNYFFPYELKLNAVSMAQPHGGSIRECAFKSDQKDCDPYRVSFVPIAYATGENYAH
jgi:hypothetical protein